MSGFSDMGNQKTQHAKRCRASRRAASKSSGAAALVLPSSQSWRRRLRSSCRNSRLNCQSRILSRTISLVVAYSPVSMAARRAPICSPVNAMLNLVGGSGHGYCCCDGLRASAAATDQKAEAGKSRLELQWRNVFAAVVVTVNVLEVVPGGVTVDGGWI
jgi:hypothetical protein